MARQLPAWHHIDCLYSLDAAYVDDSCQIDEINND